MYKVCENYKDMRCSMDTSSIFKEFSLIHWTLLFSSIFCWLCTLKLNVKVALFSLLLCIPEIIVFLKTHNILFALIAITAIVSSYLGLTVMYYCKVERDKFLKEDLELNTKGGE